MQFKKKRQFFVTVTALLCGGFLAVNLAGYLVSVASLQNQISRSTLPLTSDNIYSVIQNDLLRPVFISSLMANDTFVRDWVIAGEANAENMVKYLAEIQRRYNTVSTFFVSEKSRSYYHHKGVLKQVDPKEERDAWYFRVRDMQDDYEINVDFDMANRDAMTIFINYRVLDYEGQFIGATGVGLTVNSVTSLIDNYRQRFNREVYFINGQGGITLLGDGSIHEGKQNIGEYISEEILKEIYRDKQHGFTYRLSGKRILLNSRYIPELKWYLMVEQSGDEVNNEVLKAFLLNLLVCLLIIVLVLWISHRTFSIYQKRLEEMATIDPLTGLFNRQTFELFFSEIHKEQARQYRSLALLMIDIDHFKRVNDSFGHQTGDVVLKWVAERIASLVRESDLLGRWGGEEFLVLLKDCDLVNGISRAEKIRDAITTQDGGRGIPVSVTVSIGLAIHEQGEGVEEYIDRVDRALYQAKSQGRNRVAVV